MSDGSRCHYCRKVPCVCDSIPRPTRAKWRVGCKVPLNVYENDRPMFQCHTPEDAAKIVKLLNGVEALLDENEALAKALEYLIQKIDDSDGIDTGRLEQCRAVLAEYAKRKQEGR